MNHCINNLNWIAASKKAKLTMKRKMEDRIEQYNINPSKCIYCHKILDYSKRHNKFCNSTCAALYNTPGKKHTEETKNKISNSVKTSESFWKKTNIRFPPELRKIYIPEYTKIFQYDKSKNRSWASYIGGVYHPTKSCIKCGSVGKVLYLGSLCSDCKLIYYNYYVVECKFKFDVFKFPDEFNLDLLNMYGWYSPSNKGNNLNGVSKDHIFSVKHAFLDSIDPKIIRHPSNCQLIRQKENQRKNRNSLITLSDLLIKIECFNLKYSITEW